MLSLDSTKKLFSIRQISDINDFQILMGRFSMEKERRLQDSIALENFKYSIEKRYYHQNKVIKVVSTLFLIVSGLYFFSF